MIEVNLSSTLNTRNYFSGVRLDLLPTPHSNKFQRKWQGI